jgi:NAD(P)-dependent dehydrogenase (short-subunit alcohol dehydrogenase family)
MTDFRGARVLITGGAAGIGKLMGEAVLRKGAELIIWDISARNIAATLAELSAHGKATAMRVDVADTEAVLQAAAEVRSAGGTPDVLINIERNRMMISMPWTMHFVRFSQGIMPIRLFDWFVGGILGVYGAMEHFTGRTE